MDETMLKILLALMATCGQWIAYICVAKLFGAFNS